MNSGPAIERLLLLDPELGNPGGHYAGFAEVIRLACKRAGIGFEALGGTGSAAAVFDGIAAEYVPRWLGGALVNPWIGARKMRQQLDRDVSGRCDSRTLVFAATANHRHYAALGGWLAGLPAEFAPPLAVMLRFPEYDARRGAWSPTVHLTRFGLRRLEAVAPRRSLRLVADSDGLAAEYRQLTRLPVAELPIPHMLPESRGERLRAANAPLRFGFFGEARREKGFEILLEALEMLSSAGQLGGLEFVVQSYVRDGFAAQAALGAANRLAGRPRQNVRLIEGEMDAARFADEVFACDVLVLPYLAECYRTRNSGIFTDALAAGVAVVVTEGTWMAEQLQKHPGAGVCVPDRDPRALAAAVARMAGRPGFVRAGARTEAAAWREAHDPALFLRGLVELFD